ncbi:hypothetical protein [Microbacterium sp.]|jgi:hypothetical protein|uniref:alpha/beta fold hydrolase n=1 Tax=Microbacterium sp. TaxID=51671 RepID=UPI002B86A451|nr:hypothetical protein [Microbacterium sp.]HWL77432.1 hypothetical protein [Microbacterium sp.]
MAMSLPYAEVEFDKKGGLVDRTQLEELDALLTQKHPTDVIVISHGWNNTQGQARALYDQLVDSIVAVRGKVAGARQRRFVVVGVLWPSIQWAPDENSGAGAGVGDSAAELETEIRERVEDRAIADRLVALVPRLEGSSAAQEEFLELLRETLPKSTKGEDVAAFTALKEADPQEVIAAAKTLGAEDAAPAAAGGAASIDPSGLPPLPEDGGGAGLFDNVIQMGRNLLNITTYYTMKERAGVVGKKGVAVLLDHVHDEADDARIHLVGHSFGGRAVTAAALATKAPIASMSLLQAAYSHFGMATDWDGSGTNGMFAKVPSKISGPIIVTHTHRDKAVGLAYPIASRLARQIGQGLGDENDPYGGIGRNGALKTKGAKTATMLDVGGRYDFSGPGVWSLKSDDFISGHSAVTGRQVGYAVLSAVMA